MSQYCHLTILKRERIFLLHEEGFSISIIGNDIQHSPFTILHELRRNKKKLITFQSGKKLCLSKKKCGRYHILNDP